MRISIEGRHIYSLQHLGAVAIPVLEPAELATLVAEAAALEFRKREEVTDTNVTQDFAGVERFAPDSVWMSLAANTARLLNRALCRWQVLGTPLAFSDLSLQRYPVSQPGQAYAISPHLDHKCCVTLVAVYVLRGSAPFCICKDRAGSDPVEVKALPGDLILMRGVGFEGRSWRPFHFVGPVTEERLTFGLRHTADRKSLPRQYHAKQGEYHDHQNRT